MKYLFLFILWINIISGQDLFKPTSNYALYQTFLSQNTKNSLEELDLCASKFKEIFNNNNFAENDSSAELFMDKYIEVMYFINALLQEEQNFDLNITGIYEVLNNYNGNYNDSLKNMGIKTKDFEFYKKLKNYSIKFDMSEGMIYSNFSDCKYFNNNIAGYISPEANKYFCTLIDEYANEAFKDAGIVVTIEELVDRMITWENLYKLNLHNRAKLNIKEKFTNYFSILFEGTDNTPAFSFYTNKLDKRFEKAYKFLIKKYKCSVTANIFNNYLSLLKKSGNRSNKKSEKFILENIETIDRILNEKNIKR